MGGMRRWIVRFLVAMLIVIPVTMVAIYIVNPFGARSVDPRQRIVGLGLYRVPASNMSPGASPGQVLVTRAGYYVKRQPQRGDVVTLLVPKYEGQLWLQRIIGLPGETIAIVDGTVHIDGHPLEEPYVAAENVRTAYSQAMDAVRIPADHYFLLGDNRDNSEDSRLLDPTRREDITGKVIARLQ
ncbi:signal peptidase I Serine peptidase. MEROPS family S26A [Pseudoxanthomonas wuyuanensis]|uniref:Signal peptidase I n=2 Tax=Pseudoxanthomonas wuyuanensis TaxID=1073196 RepID=A0A286D6Y8_9GAMM|nr:signal peptidase I [Pseudoxanthomonas wuyuanensis]SOD54406.1 signal peptidase I Serine peptidase. MEROPS family S26A [Pseudoxanthomonas wuyuanensis]